jgi:hypothetical protein
MRRRNRFGSAFVIGADTAIGIELCKLLREDETSLWLVDPAGIDAPDAQSSIPGPVLLLSLPDASAPAAVPQSLISLIGTTRADHVTAIADHTARRELEKIRGQLADTSCTHTLATVARPASWLRAGPRAFSLTAREAAERIYLATLQRRPSVWPHPNPWPPRRGASEAPTPDDVCLLPLLRRA